MPGVRFRSLLVVVALIGVLQVVTRGDLTGDVTGNTAAPAYSAAGLVQAAAQVSEPLSPNSIATLYGANLSFNTHSLGPEDLSGGELPLELEGVSVVVDYIPVPLLFVSPGQINFLIPYNITGNTATLFVLRQNLAGPVITVPLVLASPSFFTWNVNLAIATHVDGSLVSPSSPASAGEIVVFYAAGLGRTSPDILTGELVTRAATLLYISQLQVLFNGVPSDPRNIYYAGVTPGFAGLYQINIRLPSPLPSNPSVQIGMGAQVSPAGLYLPTF